MKSRRTAGFTIIELMVVILIGSILTGFALNSFQNAQAAIAASSARNMYETLHMKARARAIELGETVLFLVNTAGDSAFLFSNGAVSDVTNFRRELNVDLRSTPASFLICMTPRGYADPDCPAFMFTATTDQPLRLEFWLNADSTSVVILPMGQLVGM